MKRRSRSLERRNSRYGRLFVLPWEIGLALFFLYPLTQSVLWSFSDVAWKDGELQVIFAGLKHYRNILFVDGNYTYFLTDEIRSFCLSLPLIVILSLIFALILNMKLPGRMIARGIFFLPVIIASDVVIKMLFANGNAGPDSATVYTSDLIDLDLVLRDLGMPEKIVSLFSGVIGNIFDLIWKCGIQTVLFIAGLQTIPDALYEVARRGREPVGGVLVHHLPHAQQHGGAGDGVHDDRFGDRQKQHHDDDTVHADDRTPDL